MSTVFTVSGALMQVVTTTGVTRADNADTAGNFVTMGNAFNTQSH
jgi:hypothetical protein